MTGRSQTPCKCEWTPGIALPTWECEQHRDDPALAHRGRSQAGVHLRAFRDAVEAMEDAITDEEREAQAAEALHHAMRLDRVADLGRLLASDDARETP